MTTRQTSLKHQQGQAAIETILLSFVLIAFVAAAYQMFQVNQAVYHSLTAVHQLLFARAFERNCSDHRSECEYSSDPASANLGGVAPRVVWSPEEVPEIVIPVVGMFGRYGLGDGGQPRLWSDKRQTDNLCPGLPCKRTKLGAGTYKNPIAGLLMLTQIDFQGIDPGQAVESLGFLGDILYALY